MRCVRINFSKTGRIKYVSHLDIMRCMTRAVRRAAIPLWYTEGYNPHPYLNFLNPLPLGVEGRNELLDIRIEGDITNESIMNALNDVLPSGLFVNHVYEPFGKSNDVAYADYELVFEWESGLSEVLAEAMESGELQCEKTGKINGRKKIKTVNVSENINRYEINCNDNEIILRVVFPCGNTKNVNPVNLLAALNAYSMREIVPLNITRLSLLDGKLSVFE